MYKTLDIINKTILFFALIWLALSLCVIILLSLIKTFLKITYNSIKNKFKSKNEKNITVAR